MSASPLIIIGSYTSPFVRMVRVACEELNIPYEMDVTTFFAKNSAEQEAKIKEHNPLMRVPVLIDGETTLFDSRIIVSYLIHHYGKGNAFADGFPLSPQQENILSTINGILDAGVLWFILKNTQPNIHMQEGYAARSQERLHVGLEWLDKQTAFGAHFGVTESALIAALDWFKKRGVVDWHDYANLTAVHARFAERESLVSTAIPADA